MTLAKCFGTVATAVHKQMEQMQLSPGTPRARGGDQDRDCRQLLHELPRLFFDQAVSVGDAAARMLKFEEGLDEARLDETAFHGRVLEDIPGKGAVPLSFFSYDLQKFEEGVSIFDVDQIFDGYEDRTLIV